MREGSLYKRIHLSKFQQICIQEVWRGWPSFRPQTWKCGELRSWKNLVFSFLSSSRHFELEDGLEWKMEKCYFLFSKPIFYVFYKTYFGTSLSGGCTSLLILNFGIKSKLIISSSLVHAQLFMRIVDFFFRNALLSRANLFLLWYPLPPSTNMFLKSTDI